MKEAIGGGWLLGFVIVFVVLFSGYLAASINYTKAFKIKNKIINLIETNEGFIESLNDLNSLTEDELEADESTEAKIFMALKEIGYYTSSEVNCSESGVKPCSEGGYCPKEGGYCLMKISTDSGNYYKIKTFILFNLDLINFSIQIPIKGETKVIYHDRSI